MSIPTRLPILSSPSTLFQQEAATQLTGDPTRRYVPWDPVKKTFGFAPEEANPEDHHARERRDARIARSNNSNSSSKRKRSTYTTGIVGERKHHQDRERRKDPDYDDDDDEEPTPTHHHHHHHRNKRSKMKPGNFKTVEWPDTIDPNWFKYESVESLCARADPNEWKILDVGEISKYWRSTTRQGLLQIATQQIIDTIGLGAPITFEREYGKKISDRKQAMMSAEYARFGEDLFRSLMEVGFALMIWTPDDKMVGIPRVLDLSLVDVYYYHTVTNENHFMARLRKRNDAFGSSRTTFFGGTDLSSTPMGNRLNGHDTSAFLPNVWYMTYKNFAPNWEDGSINSVVKLCMPEIIKHERYEAQAMLRESRANFPQVYITSKQIDLSEFKNLNSEATADRIERFKQQRDWLNVTTAAHLTSNNQTLSEALATVGNATKLDGKKDPFGTSSATEVARVNRLADETRHFSSLVSTQRIKLAPGEEVTFAPESKVDIDLSKSLEMCITMIATLFTAPKSAIKPNDGLREWVVEVSDQRALDHRSTWKNWMKSIFESVYHIINDQANILDYLEDSTDDDDDSDHDEDGTYKRYGGNTRHTDTYVSHDGEGGDPNVYYYNGTRSTSTEVHSEGKKDERDVARIRSRRKRIPRYVKLLKGKSDLNKETAKATDMKIGFQMLPVRNHIIEYYQMGLVEAKAVQDHAMNYLGINKKYFKTNPDPPKLVYIPPQPKNASSSSGSKSKGTGKKAAKPKPKTASSKPKSALKAAASGHSNGKVRATAAIHKHRRGDETDVDEREEAEASDNE